MGPHRHLPVSASMAELGLLKLTFEDGAVVLNDQEEYLLDAGQELKSVGDVVSFLELQEKFRGKSIVPYSAKQRVIASKTGASSAVAFVKIEHPGQGGLAAPAFSQPAGKFIIFRI